MTNEQEAQEKMSLSTVSFLLGNATITANLPRFSDYFSIVQESNTKIQTVKVQQQADKSGDTANKNEIKTDLIAQILDNERKMIAYATNEGNNILLAQMSYSESYLKKSSDSKLASICQIVHDSISNHLTELASYDITAEGLVALQTLINRFNVAIPKGRVDATTSGQATQQLDVLFKTLMTNWGKIDTLVEIVRTRQPEFYAGYQKVRMIIVAGSGSLSLKIKVTDLKSSEGLANVTLSITSVGAPETSGIIKKTAAGGGSNVKSLNDGDYTVTTKKPGYKDATATVSVVNGESSVLNITMEKL